MRGGGVEKQHFGKGKWFNSMKKAGTKPDLGLANSIVLPAELLARIDAAVKHTRTIEDSRHGFVIAAIDLKLRIETGEPPAFSEWVFWWDRFNAQKEKSLRAEARRSRRN
jgi:flavin reductase (DIM6/NTAB) family NADH-FMN oxidoreductase RutF